MIGETTAPLTADDIRGHLAWVEGRIAAWTAAGSHTDSLPKYQACAAELHELLAVTGVES